MKEAAIRPTVRGGAFVKQEVRADGSGKFATIIRMSADLPHGEFTLDTAPEGKASAAFATFVKGDGEDDEPESADGRNPNDGLRK